MLTAADAPTSMLAPASIAALVKIRSVVRRLRAKAHASITLIADEASGAVAVQERIETYQLEKNEKEEEFLARVWARYKAGGHTAIAFSVHDGRLTAKISTSREAEQMRLLTEQLAHVSMQIAAFNAYLRAAGHDPAAAGGYELESKEFQAP